MRPGIVHSAESSATYDPLGSPGKSADRGGCVNQLTNHRSQSKKSSSMSPNACLIQIELWNGDIYEKPENDAKIGKGEPDEQVA